MNKKTLGLVAALAAIILAGYQYWTRTNMQSLTQNQSLPQDSPGANQASEEITTVATNLQVPWEILLLPSRHILATQREGSLVIINLTTGARKTIAIPETEANGEGGLLGAALHPDFSKQPWLYLYFTTKTGNRIINRVQRYRLENDALSEPKIIVDNIPGGRFHDGGRIAFGPDGYLYITTGDAGVENLAQDKNSLAGKILRVTEDGAAPGDNPFGSLVYSYGHRNPQGLAWDGASRLWATEHGRSGKLSGYDELNLVSPGKNYGWPTIEGDESAAGLVTPAVQSGATETWAPADAVHYKGRIIFTGLRGQSLYVAELDGAEVKSVEAMLVSAYGRLRALAMDDEGNLYVSTSNTDGRGQPREGDDRILRLNLERIVNE